jgi:hypothetical protein
MNRRYIRMPDARWKLCLRLAGVAAGIWAIISILLRHR